MILSCLWFDAFFSSAFELNCDKTLIQTVRIFFSSSAKREITSYNNVVDCKLNECKPHLNDTLATVREFHHPFLGVEWERHILISQKYKIENGPKLGSIWIEIFGIWAEFSLLHVRFSLWLSDFFLSIIQLDSSELGVKKVTSSVFGLDYAFEYILYINKWFYIALTVAFAALLSRTTKVVLNGLFAYRV